MDDNKINDERVIYQKRKITNEAYILIMTFLICSLLIKQLVFRLEFSEYAIEFICFFGASFYILIRNILIGNNLFSNNSDRKKMMVVNSFVSGLTIAAVTFYNLIRKGTTFNDTILNLILTFIISTLSSFITWFAITKLSQRRIEIIEKKLDDEED